MPIEIKTANTNGIEMRYFSFGSGPKNMVIIPGLDVTSVTNVAGLVSNQYSDFHEDYTVYVIDRRTNLPNPYSIEQMAEEVGADLVTKGSPFGGMDTTFTVEGIRFIQYGIEKGEE